MNVLVTVVLICLVVQSGTFPVTSNEPLNFTRILNRIFRPIILGVRQATIDEETPPPTTTTTSSSIPVVVERDNRIAREVLVSGNNTDEGSAIVFSDVNWPPRPEDNEVIMTTSRDEGNRVVFPGESLDHGTDVTRTPINDGSGDFVFPTENKIRNVSPASEETHKGNCTLKNGLAMLNGTCWELLKQGPCGQDEWLLLEGNIPMCVYRPCPFGQLEHNGHCVDAADLSVCSDGKILYVDFSGFTMCDCEPNLIYDPWSDKCFAQHEKGFCDFGEYIEVSDSGSLVCVRNECVMDGYVKDTVTNRCYRKMYRGYCDQPMIFNQETGTAVCAYLDIRNVLDVVTLRACPTGSRRDSLNDCRVEFRVPSVVSFQGLDSGCPPGSIKGPGGICRRVHRLFG